MVDIGTQPKKGSTRILVNNLVLHFLRTVRKLTKIGTKKIEVLTQSMSADAVL